MRHSPRTRSKYFVSAPSLIIAFKIFGDVALPFPSNSSGQHDVDQISLPLMFDFQIKPKGEQVLCRQAVLGVEKRSALRVTPRHGPLQLLDVGCFSKANIDTN
jgi:hypothetical protein